MSSDSDGFWLLLWYIQTFRTYDMNTEGNDHCFHYYLIALWVFCTCILLFFLRYWERPKCFIARWQRSTLVEHFGLSQNWGGGHFFIHCSRPLASARLSCQMMCVSFISNMTGVTCGAGTAYPSWAPDFPWFSFHILQAMFIVK
jgi:hypothetical protein